MIEFRKGKALDRGSLAIFAAAILIFIVLRVFSLSVFDSRRVLQAIERDLIAEYQQSVYAQRYENNAVDSDADGAGAFPSSKFKNLEIAISSVSMAAPLYSWSGKENVGVCFDYVISTDEGVVESKKRVYKKVTREKGYHVWDSNIFFHFMTYILN